MLRRFLQWAYRKLGSRYPRVAVAVQFQFAHVVVAGGVLLLAMYIDIDHDTFWRIMAVTQGMVAVENLCALVFAWRLIRPSDPWLRGDRTPETAVEAWRALAGLPLDFVRYRRGLPVVLNIVPASLYIWLEIGGPVFPDLLALGAGSAVVLLYGVFLRFFALELIMYPVLAEVSAALPDGATFGKRTLPLKWRMLIALPAINIISGVTVVGLAAPDEAGLDTFGVGILLTLAVAATISLELSILLLRTIIGPVRDLTEGTRRVARGDFAVRVPVLGTDEPGELAGSFNRMVQGLAEREKLREAFGAFVDPELADRVLAEGTILEGDEVEVSILFLDIRDFTAFAEQASAREVVQRLNEFYELVVPVLHEHGGHANKFVGDGLLGVFGAPDRRTDHADRAVAAACQIARLVDGRYGEDLRIGIGVNSGPVVAGTIGGDGRVEFTVIGDPVNTAARVESLTRDTGDVVLVTEQTRCLLTRDHGGFLERGAVELKGKREAVTVWAPERIAGVPASVRASQPEREAFIQGLP